MFRRDTIGIKFDRAGVGHVEKTNDRDYEVEERYDISYKGITSRETDRIWDIQADTPQS